MTRALTNTDVYLSKMAIIDIVLKVSRVAKTLPIKQELSFRKTLFKSSRTPCHCSIKHKDL